MPRWDTHAIVKLLSGPDRTVTTGPAGGDYDTTEIWVRPKGIRSRGLTVRGFRPEEPLTNEERDSVEIECIEVRSPESDSRGGYQGHCRATMAVYADILCKLREKGFFTYDHYDQFF